METYESIKQWKDQHIRDFLEDIVSLNDFHDQIMRKVMAIALMKMHIPQPPCSFAFFITGSGGRKEQGIISDQDHGIVYEVSNELCDEYFKKLGEEVSEGLFRVGYPYCQGKIMTSNPMWCQSLTAWKSQIQQWMIDERWEAIRYVQIFFDARTLYGEEAFLLELKTWMYTYQKQHPNVLRRLTETVMHVKQVIGPMGQILGERYGPYQGYLNLKYAAFLPYVNAVRLLAMKEGVFETSTLDRMNRLIIVYGYATILLNCEKNFQLLLQYRLSLAKATTYADTHYLHLDSLTKQQMKELKRMIKDGKRLHDEVVEYIVSNKKGVDNGI